MRGGQRVTQRCVKGRSYHADLGNTQWRGAATSHTASSSRLLHGITPQADIFVKQRPLMEGVLRAQFNRHIELTLLHGVEGTSTEGVSATLERETQTLQERTVKSDPDTSLTSLFERALTTSAERAPYGVTELLEELGCTARVELDHGQATKRACDGYGGAVYITDAWEPSPHEQRIAEADADKHATLSGLISELTAALQAHLTGMRSRHLRAALREASLRLADADSLTAWDPVYEAPVPLFRHSAPDGQQERRQSRLAVTFLHHQPTARVLCARLVVDDTQGTRLDCSVPLLSLRSRRDFVYTPHLPYPYLALSRLRELVEQGSRDGTVVAQAACDGVPCAELIWWAFTMLNRASPQVVFALNCHPVYFDAPGPRASATTVTSACFAHVPVRVPALIGAEGRINLRAWLEEKAASGAVHRADGGCCTELVVTDTRRRGSSGLLGRTVRGISRQALTTQVGKEVGWRHAPMVQLGTLRASLSETFTLSFPSVAAVHVRSGACRTLASTFASVAEALDTVFPSAFAPPAESSRAVSQTMGQDRRSKETRVHVRLLSIDALLRRQGVISVRLRQGTLLCRNDAGEDLIQFPGVTTVEGYVSLLEFAARRQPTRSPSSHPSSDNGCVVEVTLPANTTDTTAQLAYLLNSAMGHTEPIVTPSQLAKRLRLPLPLDPTLFATVRVRSRVECAALERRLLSLLQHFSPDGRAWPLPTPVYTTFFTHWPITRLVLRNLAQNHPGFRYTITSSQPRATKDSEEADVGDPPAARTHTSFAVFYSHETQELARVALPADGGGALTAFYDQCRALARMSTAEKTLQEVAPAFVLTQSKIAGGSRMTYQSLVAALFRHDEEYVCQSGDTASSPSTGRLQIRLTSECVVTLALSSVLSERGQWREALAKEFVETHMPSLVPVLRAHNEVAAVAAALDMAQGETVPRSHACLLIDHREAPTAPRATSPKYDDENDPAIAVSSPGSLNSPELVPALPHTPAAGGTAEPWCEAVLVALATDGRSGEDVTQVLQATGGNRAEALMALAQRVQRLRTALDAFQQPSSTAGEASVHGGHADTLHHQHSASLLARLQQRLADERHVSRVYHRHDTQSHPPLLVLLGEPSSAPVPSAPDAEGHDAPAASVVLAAVECPWCDIPRKLFALYREALHIPADATKVAANAGDRVESSPTSPFKTFHDMREIVQMPVNVLVTAVARALHKPESTVRAFVREMDLSSVNRSGGQWLGQLSLPVEMLQCRSPDSGSAPSPQRSDVFAIRSRGNTVRHTQRYALVALYVWFVCGLDEPIPFTQTAPPWVPLEAAFADAISSDEERRVGVMRLSDPPASRVPSASPRQAALGLSEQRSSSSPVPSHEGCVAPQSLLGYLLTDLEAKLCALDVSHAAPASRQPGKLVLRLTHVLGLSLSFHVVGQSSQPRAASPRVKVRQAKTKDAKPIPLSTQCWDPRRLHLVQLLEFVADANARIAVGVSNALVGQSQQSEELPPVTVSLQAIEHWPPLRVMTVMEFCVSFFRRYLGLRLVQPDSLSGFLGQLCISFDTIEQFHPRGTSTHTARLRLLQFGMGTTTENQAAFSVSLCEVFGTTRESAVSLMWTECARDIRRTFHLQRNATQEEIDSAVLMTFNVALG